MVLATAATVEDSVVSAVGDAYRTTGGTVIETDLEVASGVSAPGRAIVAGDVAVVECVADPEQPIADLGAAVSRMAADGWAVTVLVPMIRLGEAHKSLRGRPAVVQGWWVEGEAIRFGAHETL